MPRSLKICTAAGDSASEMRTLGFDIVNSFAPSRMGSASWANVVKSLIEFLSLSPFLRGEGWGEGQPQARVRALRAPHPDCCAIRPLPVRTGRGEKKSRRLRQRGPGLGERPVDPLGQQRDVLCLDGGAAPDAQARRRIAIMREIVPGAF